MENRFVPELQKIRFPVVGDNIYETLVKEDRVRELLGKSEDNIFLGFVDGAVDVSDKVDLGEIIYIPVDFSEFFFKLWLHLAEVFGVEGSWYFEENSTNF